MWPARERVIQDPVHGMMTFRDQECLILDLLRCPEIQRLRRIRQLGFASSVFPGAEHSRFVHSLGVAYLASRFARHLRQVGKYSLPPTLRPDEAVLGDLCIAALCHDLGHGPFSHVWERVVIGENWDRQAWVAKLGLAEEQVNIPLKWHELVTAGFLQWPEGQLHRLLELNEAGLARRVVEMLQGQPYFPCLSNVLASDVDADRCDFVLRDAQMAGLTTSGIQVHRIIASYAFGFDDNHMCHCGLSTDKGLTVASELLHARAGLYRTLYFHKTILGMEWLLGQLLSRLKNLAMEGHLRPAGAAIPPIVHMLQGQPVSQRSLCNLDDYSIWTLILGAGELTRDDPTALGLAQRIIDRDPLRAVPLPGGMIEEFFNKDNDADDKVRNIISTHVEGEPDYFYKKWTPTFSLWEDVPAKSSCLVDSVQRRWIGKLSNHESMKTQFPLSEERREMLLLVPREARPSVTKLLLDRR